MLEKDKAHAPSWKPAYFPGGLIMRPRFWPPKMCRWKWGTSCRPSPARAAGRTLWGEAEESLRAGYARLFAAHAIPIDASDPAELVLFPEMDAELDVPEISESCWDTLGVSPDAMMCATSRMIIKRKGAAQPAVVACTLLPYEAEFELGETLADSARAVKLNHPHCARFCVLGGGACSKPD